MDKIAALTKEMEEINAAQLQLEEEKTVIAISSLKRAILSLSRVCTH